MKKKIEFTSLELFLIIYLLLFVGVFAGIWMENTRVHIANPEDCLQIGEAYNCTNTSKGTLCFFNTTNICDARIEAVLEIGEKK